MPSRVKRVAKDVVVKPDWWKAFFGKQTGDLMFDHFVPGLAEKEIAEILRRVKIKKNPRVLDVACGRGRHSVELARRGFEVVGLDYCGSYLAEARRARRTLPDPGRLRLVQGDMRHLEGMFEPDSVDLVLSLFNSFGYFPTRADDADVLRQMATVLRPGGALVISTLSRSGVEHFLGRSSMRNWIEFEPGSFYLDHSVYNAKRARLHSQWLVVRAGMRNVQRFSYEQNVYSSEELRAYLDSFGMRVERVWGSLGTGRPFRPDAWDLTLVARKQSPPWGDRLDRG